MGKSMFTRRQFGLMGISLLAGGAVRAQEGYPHSPVKIVVPYSAGGASDIVARLIAANLMSSLGQPVVDENRPGANGIVAATLVSKAAPDGYTLMVVSSGHSTNSAINDSVPFDPVKDFTMITQVGKVSMVVVVDPGAGIDSVASLVAKAKAAPGAIKYGSGGIGASNHLAVELFASTVGVQFTHVPYKGDAPAIQDLLGGRIDFMFLGPPSAQPLADAGKVVPIAVTDERRLPLMPDVPTVTEAYAPFTAGSWHAVIAPAGLPGPVLERLNREIVAIVRRPEVTAKLAELGIQAIGSEPAVLQALMTSEVRKWKEMVRTGKIKL